MAPPSYRITVTPAAVSLFAGAAANLTVTVTPVNGFSGAVTLDCSNLPSESACTFADAAIPAGGGSTNLTLTTMFPHDCGSNVPYGGFGSLHAPSGIFGFGKALGCCSPALAGLILLLLPRRTNRRTALRITRRTKFLSTLAVLCLLSTLSGCGSRCTDFGTTPGSYTFKVNGRVPDATPVATGGSLPGGTATPTVSASVALSVKP